ncbi:hypothetical protein J6590_025775 [Homalodisca vitripennis]|nr:hypothetical protein J6590_025775 [Homalodisca vitripennis]
MAAVSCRLSHEVDRELEEELDSENSADIFDDDSDNDPTHNPNDDPSSSNRPFMPSRPVLDSLSDSNVELSQDRPRSQPTKRGRRQHISSTRPRPINRQVLSDSSENDLACSSDSENNVRPIDVTNQTAETWEKTDENDGMEFVHSFSFLETPGPRHCNLDPMTAKPISYFSLFFTNTLLQLFLTETNRYATQTLTSRGNNLFPHSKFRSWVPVSLIEIKAFIAVLLNMVLIRKPTIKSY